MRTADLPVAGGTFAPKNASDISQAPPVAIPYVLIAPQNLLKLQCLHDSSASCLATLGATMSSPSPLLRARERACDWTQRHAEPAPYGYGVACDLKSSRPGVRNQDGLPADGPVSLQPCSCISDARGVEINARCQYNSATRSVVPIDPMEDYWPC